MLPSFEWPCHVVSLNVSFRNSVFCPWFFQASCASLPLPYCTSAPDYIARLKIDTVFMGILQLHSIMRWHQKLQLSKCSRVRNFPHSVPVQFNQIPPLNSNPRHSETAHRNKINWEELYVWYLVAGLSKTLHRNPSFSASRQQTAHYIERLMHWKQRFKFFSNPGLAQLSHFMGPVCKGCCCASLWFSPVCKLLKCLITGEAVSSSGIWQNREKKKNSQVILPEFTCF